MSENNTTYPVLAPCIAVNGAAAAIKFYEAAFGAVERFRLIDPESGKVGHAELLIDGALLMLSDEYPTHGKAPTTVGGITGRLCLMVENVDQAVARAVSAGATVSCPAADHFYGFRGATIRDPSGHEWTLQQMIEALSPEEMQARWNAMVTG